MEKYKKKITPRRYVYHISKNVFRNSIIKSGLIGKSNSTIGYTNAVFAHNNCDDLLLWYPFILDIWDLTVKTGGKTITKVYTILNYDVWRIDTGKITNEWFIDNVAQNDFLDKSEYPFYIVTFENIDPSALKLVDLENPLKIFNKNGVTHIVNEFK